MLEPPEIKIIHKKSYDRGFGLQSYRKKTYICKRLTINCFALILKYMVWNYLISKVITNIIFYHENINLQIAFS